MKETKYKDRLDMRQFRCLHDISFYNNNYYVGFDKDLLFGKKTKYKIPAHPLNRKGGVEAELVGGNLSLIYALSGSVDDLITKNKVLFIEMKDGKNTQSKEQIDFEEVVTKLNHSYYLCYTLEQFQQIIWQNLLNEQ